MSTARRSVFIVGSHVPAGGTRMAHRIGRLAAERFGFHPVCIQVGETQNGYAMFGDPPIDDVLTVDEAMQQARPDDLLVCNPSFSPLSLGGRFPGRKLCYVQGITTFTTLDVRFDHYVSVSSTVRDYLKSIYELDTSVIPPFISAIDAARLPPWRERKHALLAFSKQVSPLQSEYLDFVINRIRDAHPNLPVEILNSYALSQEEFFGRIAQVRYFMAFSTVEGFGLMPLEAMACGAVVVGLDGVGGRDYMTYGVNCATQPLSDLSRVADAAIEAIGDVGMGAAMSHHAMATARAYSQANFDQRWTTELSTFLGEPAHA